MADEEEKPQNRDVLQPDGTEQGKGDDMPGGPLNGDVGESAGPPEPLDQDAEPILDEAEDPLLVATGPAVPEEIMDRPMEVATGPGREKDDKSEPEPAPKTQDPTSPPDPGPEARTNISPELRKKMDAWLAQRGGETSDDDKRNPWWESAEDPTQDPTSPAEDQLGGAGGTALAQGDSHMGMETDHRAAAASPPSSTEDDDFDPWKFPDDGGDDDKSEASTPDPADPPPSGATPPGGPPATPPPNPPVNPIPPTAPPNYEPVPGARVFILGFSAQVVETELNQILHALRCIRDGKVNHLARLGVNSKIITQTHSVTNAHGVFSIKVPKDKHQLMAVAYHPQDNWYEAEELGWSNDGSDPTFKGNPLEFFAPMYRNDIVIPLNRTTPQPPPEPSIKLGPIGVEFRGANIAPDAAGVYYVPQGKKITFYSNIEKGVPDNFRWWDSLAGNRNDQRKVSYHEYAKTQANPLTGQMNFDETAGDYVVGLEVYDGDGEKYEPETVTVRVTRREEPDEPAEIMGVLTPLNAEPEDPIYINPDFHHKDPFEIGPRGKEIELLDNDQKNVVEAGLGTDERGTFYVRRLEDEVKITVARQKVEENKMLLPGEVVEIGLYYFRFEQKVADDRVLKNQNEKFPVTLRLKDGFKPPAEWMGKLIPLNATPNDPIYIDPKSVNNGRFELGPDGRHVKLVDNADARSFKGVQAVVHLEDDKFVLSRGDDDVTIEIPPPDRKLDPATAPFAPEDRLYLDKPVQSAVGLDPVRLPTNKVITIGHYQFKWFETAYDEHLYGRQPFPIVLRLSDEILFSEIEVRPEADRSIFNGRCHTRKGAALTFSADLIRGKPEEFRWQLYSAHENEELVETGETGEDGGKSMRAVPNAVIRGRKLADVPQDGPLYRSSSKVPLKPFDRTFNEEGIYVLVLVSTYRGRRYEPRRMIIDVRRDWDKNAEGMKIKYVHYDHEGYHKIEVPEDRKIKVPARADVSAIGVSHHKQRVRAEWKLFKSQSDELVKEKNPEIFHWGTEYGFGLGTLAEGRYDLVLSSDQGAKDVVEIEVVPHEKKISLVIEEPKEGAIIKLGDRIHDLSVRVEDSAHEHHHNETVYKYNWYIIDSKNNSHHLFNRRATTDKEFSLPVSKELQPGPARVVVQLFEKGKLDVELARAEVSVVLKVEVKPQLPPNYRLGFKVLNHNGNRKVFRDGEVFEYKLNNVPENDVIVIKAMIKERVSKGIGLTYKNAAKLDGKVKIRCTIDHKSGSAFLGLENGHVVEDLRPQEEVINGSGYCLFHYKVGKNKITHNMKLKVIWCHPSLNFSD